MILNNNIKANFVYPLVGTASFLSAFVKPARKPGALILSPPSSLHFWCKNILDRCSYSGKAIEDIFYQQETREITNGTKNDV